MKRVLSFSLVLLCFALVSWSHKFYVGIYQVHHNPEKKMLEVTCRIFTDDLNEALKKKHNRKFRIGEPDVDQSDVSAMKNYIAEHFTISVNGKSQTLDFRSFEIEANVAVCYYRVLNVPKIKTIGVRNDILFELFDDQQNIIQASANQNKQNLLLTVDNPKEQLSF